MKPYLEEFDLEGSTWPYVQCVEVTKVPLIWTKADLDLYRADAFPGEVMLDIGAFVGDTMFQFAVLGCDVLAFEPNPHTYQILKMNQDALRNKGVIIHAINAAIMPVTGEYDFNYTDDLVNGGQDIPHHNRKVKVSGIAWDDAFLQGRRLCYVKIDTEGNDFNILRSMSATIVKHRPVIRAEVFWALTLEQRAAFWLWTKQVGYKVRSGVEALLSVAPESPDVILEPI